MARLDLLLFCIFPVSVWALAASSKARGGSAAKGFGAPSSVPVIADEPADIRRLRDFLREHKADIDHLQVGQHENHGRGLFVRKAFNKVGKIICRIPSDCALALSDPAQEGKDVPTLAHQGANLLRLYLKDDTKRQQWAPYLDTLPKAPTVDRRTPDFMEDDEIELLEFPPLVKAATERKHAIAQVATATGYTEKELQDATWLVSSRSFPLAVASDDDVVTDEGDETLPSISTDDRGQILARANRSYIRLLVPWVDLVNHDSNAPNAKITIIDPHKDDAFFALEVLRPIKKGQEVRVAYGSGVQASSDLFLNYGFVPEKNRMDGVMLRHMRVKAERDADPTRAFALNDWTTTLEEDRKLLGMAKEEGEVNLHRILSFRIKMKEAYEFDNA